jgi:alanyl-tRNA synthetase
MHKISPLKTRFKILILKSVHTVPLLLILSLKSVTGTGIWQQGPEKDEYLRNIKISTLVP